MVKILNKSHVTRKIISRVKINENKLSAIGIRSNF